MPSVCPITWQSGLVSKSVFQTSRFTERDHPTIYFQDPDARPNRNASLEQFNSVEIEVLHIETEHLLVGIIPAPITVR